MIFTDKATGTKLELSDDVAIKLRSVKVGDGIDTAFFFARDLEQIKARTFDVKYAELPFRNLFPVSNEGGPGTESITYVTYDQAGMSIIISDYSRDLPRADVGGKETTVKVRETGIAVAWTQAEIRKAAKAGRSINDRKMIAAVRGNEQTLNTIAFYGDAATGLIGLFTQPNIPVADVPNGAGGNPEFTTKTPDEIVFDLMDIMNDIFTLTKMIERPNTLLLPPAQWGYIATTRLGSVNDTTILEYFVSKCPYINSAADVIPVNELTGAGTAGVDVMVAYRRDPDTAQFEEPMPLMFHPEQIKGLEVEVPAEGSNAGLNVYYPLAFSIREKI
jgi:hypothetical protein